MDGMVGDAHETSGRRSRDVSRPEAGIGAGAARSAVSSRYPKLGIGTDPRRLRLGWVETWKDITRIHRPSPIRNPRTAGFCGITSNCGRIVDGS